MGVLSRVDGARMTAVGGGVRTGLAGAAGSGSDVVLMAGRKIPDRIAVTEDEWTQFVDQEITPRFPDGLTVLSAAGQWRDPSSNKIVREPSKVVLIVLPGKAEDLARVNEIAQAYKTRFKQQFVGVIVRPACVSF